MGDFTSNAKSFIRNPLGIIGLFISLIYGAMCLVLTNIILELQFALQISLIAFIILFPILILIAFIYLVAKHHRKLYAPKDYQDEEHFMVDYLTTSEKNNKIDNEISETLGTIDLDGTKVTSQDEVQSDNKIKIPSIEASTRKDFLLLEEIALRKWERENKMFIQRQVKLHFADNLDLEVDGYGTKRDLKYIFEVNIVKEDIIPPSIIQKIKRMINIVLEENDYKVVFIIIHEKGYGKNIGEQLYKINNKKSDKFCFIPYSQESLFKEYEI